MKLLFSSRLGLFILLVLVLTVSVARAQSALKGEDDKYKTNTLWPGVNFIISNVLRIDEQNAVFVIKVNAEANAPIYTFLGSWPDGKNYTLDPKGKKIPVQPLPYSMMGGSAVDKKTHAEYSPIPQEVAVGKPFYGFSSVITTIHPHEWFQMSLKFPVPVPPPDQDGKIPIQKVDVMIPQAKGPIKDVVVPPLTK